MTQFKKPEPQFCFTKDIDILRSFGNCSLYLHNGSKTEAERKQNGSSTFLRKGTHSEGIPKQNAALQRNLPRIFGALGMFYQLYPHNGSKTEAERKQNGSKLQMSAGGSGLN